MYNTGVIGTPFSSEHELYGLMSDLIFTANVFLSFASTGNCLVNRMITTHVYDSTTYRLHICTSQTCVQSHQIKYGENKQETVK